MAAELVARHGLSSVTLEGKLTSRGSLTGGWRGEGRGGGGQRQGPLHTKLRFDVAEQARAAAEREAGQAAAAIQAAEAELVELEAAREAAEAAATEAASAEEEVLRCRLEREAAGAARAAALASAERLRSDLQVWLPLVRSRMHRAAVSEWHAVARMDEPLRTLGAHCSVHQPAGEEGAAGGAGRRWRGRLRSGCGRGPS